jgi:hypothetical protein
MFKYTRQIGWDCIRKLHIPVPSGTFRTLATIWHSKLGVLCDAARQRPNELSVLLDGGLMTSGDTPVTAAEGDLNRSFTKAEMVPKSHIQHFRALMQARDRMSIGWVDTAQRESESQKGKLQTEFYFESGEALHFGGAGKPAFGKPACNANNARVAAGVLALRGADCGAIEGAYMEAMAEIASGPCNCYDEEIVLTRMLDKAPWNDLMNPHFGP